MPVTHEEGDRYPLVPPKFYSGENEYSAGLISLASDGATPSSASSFASSVMVAPGSPRHESGVGIQMPG